MGETCARDLDLNKDCCENGSYCMMSHQFPGWGSCTSINGMFQDFKCYRWKLDSLDLFCGSQYFLFYLDEGSGDEPDEGYRFGNIGELIALRYYLFTMINYQFYYNIVYYYI